MTQRSKKGASLSKKALIEVSGSGITFLKELEEQLRPFAYHLFCSKWQFKQYKYLKNNVPPNTLLSVADFSENYRCAYQDEISSAYYNYEQATLHPFQCVYSKGDEIVTQSVIIISNDLKHDANAVEHFNRVMLEHINTQINVNRHIQWSDGCSAQYKGKGSFGILQEETTVTERHFFGTRHGKGPCDAIGATVKNKTTTYVKSRRGIVRNALELYNFCQTELSNLTRVFFYVDKEDIPPNTQKYKTVPNTRQSHAVKRSDEGLLKRKYSCFCEGCIGEGQCVNQSYVDDWVPAFSKYKTTVNFQTKKKNLNASKGKQEKKKVTGKQRTVKLTSEKSKKESRKKKCKVDEDWTVLQKPKSIILKRSSDGAIPPSKKFGATDDTSRPSTKSNVDQDWTVLKKAESIILKRSSDGGVPPSKKLATDDTSKRKSNPLSSKKFGATDVTSKRKRSPPPKKSGAADDTSKRKSSPPLQKPGATDDTSKRKSSPPPKKSGATDDTSKRKSSPPLQKPGATDDTSKRKSSPSVASSCKKNKALKVYRGVVPPNDVRTLTRALIHSPRNIQLSTIQNIDLGTIDMQINQTVVKLKKQVDCTALHQLPLDVPDTDMYPVLIEADGNCLSRAGSVLAYGTEENHMDVRLRIAIELIQHRDHYLDVVNLSRGLPRGVFLKPKDVVEMFADDFRGDISDEEVDRLFRREVHDTLKLSSYFGLWGVMALASVLGVRIYSVYPDLGPKSTREKLHRWIYPREMRNPKPAYIMWTSHREDMLAEHWVANHFSVLLPISQRLEFFCEYLSNLLV